MLCWPMPVLFEAAGIRDRQQIRFWGAMGVVAIVAGIVLLVTRMRFPLPGPLARMRRRPFNLVLAFPTRSEGQ